MAMQAKKNSMTKGLCNFCKSEIDKAKMTQHLKYCKQRAAINAANDADMEDEDEEEEEDEEDLSPEEFAEEIGKFLDEQPAELLNIIPDELQVELRKPHSRDELVALLKDRIISLPKPTFSITPANIEEQRSIHFQKLVLQFLLDMVEDRSLSVPLEKVLKVKQKFTYEYDFGSTTELNLRVISEREGVALQGEDDDVVFILARNEPPAIVCRKCGKPATKVVSGYFNVEANAYCNKCARRSEDEDMLLPVVNSPRVGVCGYTG